MNGKLFIADKIKVGFNPRKDTYTGLLGYVIGFDGKKWRKEPSWENWRYHFIGEEEYEILRREEFDTRLDSLINNNWAKERNPEYYEKCIQEFKNSYNTFSLSGKRTSDPKLKPVEFDNIPTEGFVLNKKVGGTRWSWNTRATYARVYDPRGFEFEITIPNLLFILQECNAYKGKGLEGAFVYAWDGKDLVLLPTCSQEYQDSKHFTKLQSKKIGVKNLVAGCVYRTKQLVECVYLGKFVWFDDDYHYENKSKIVDKKHVFINLSTNDIIGLTSLSTIAEQVSEKSIDNYAELLEVFNSSKHNGYLNNIEISDYSVVKETTHYVYRTTVYKQLDTNKFLIYRLESEKTNRRYYNSYYTIDSYTLTAKNMVVFDDSGNFEIKTTPNTLLEGVSVNELSKMGLKTLKINKNNIQYDLIF